MKSYTPSNPSAVCYPFLYIWRRKCMCLGICLIKQVTSHRGAGPHNKRILCNWKRIVWLVYCSIYCSPFPMVEINCAIYQISPNGCLHSAFGLGYGCKPCGWSPKHKRTLNKLPSFGWLVGRPTKHQLVSSTKRSLNKWTPCGRDIACWGPPLPCGLLHLYLANSQEHKLILR